MRIFLATLIACLAWSASAATYNAATPSVADIQAAINLTVNGDTVQAPSGTSHWITNLYVTNAISILGTGIGSTVIVDDVPASSSQHGIKWDAVTNGLSRLSGFEFDKGTNSSDSSLPGFFFISGTSRMFRIDNVYFNNLNNTFVVVRGWINGVADHTTNRMSFKQAFNIEFDNYGGASFGDGSWADDDLMGTTNEFVIESSAFTETSGNTPGAIDACGGARVAVRYNVFTNCCPTTHGTESTGRSRSVRVYENYENYQRETVSGNSSATGTYRGGTGVCFSNIYSGADYGAIMQMSCYREIYHFNYWNACTGTNAFDQNDPTIYDSGTHTGANLATTLTDSTKSWTVNQWVGFILWGNYGAGTNASVITANTATTITYRTDGTSITGGPVMDFRTGDAYQIRKPVLALDQPGAGKGLLLTSGATPTPTNLNQVVSPIYYWGNTLNGSPANGSVSGTYASITNGIHYFSNTQKPGYTPLVFPHPLVQAPDPSIDVQPTDQTVTAPASATFSVTASGTLPITYQWSRNGSTIAGATQSIYILTPTATSDSGSTFYVDVTSGAGGPTRSATATLTVNGGGGGSPVITTKTYGKGFHGQGTH